MSKQEVLPGPDLGQEGVGEAKSPAEVTPSPAEAIPQRGRYRVRFAKRGPMRWIGHLDVQKAFERLVRRASLRAVHSKGFHPRPKMVFVSALPLGTASEVELVDIWLTGDVPAERVFSLLAAAAHPDLPILDVELVVHKGPALPTLLRSARYRAELLDPLSGAVRPPPELLEQAVERVLQAEHLPRQRRKKDYDLRPLLLSLEQPSAYTLEMELRCGEGQTGRPEEVLSELGLDPADCRVARTSLVMAEEQAPTPALSSSAAEPA